MQQKRDWNQRSEVGLTPPDDEPPSYFKHYTHIANCISRRELSPEYIVPSVFNRDVVQRVAAAVIEAATETGVARKGRPRR